MPNKKLKTTTLNNNNCRCRKNFKIDKNGNTEIINRAITKTMGGRQAK